MSKESVDNRPGFIRRQTDGGKNDLSRVNNLDKFGFNHMKIYGPSVSDFMALMENRSLWINAFREIGINKFIRKAKAPHILIVKQDLKHAEDMLLQGMMPYDWMVEALTDQEIPEDAEIGPIMARVLLAMENMK